MLGTHAEMGPCAVVANDQATILLSSRKMPPMDLGQLHLQGIRPEDASYVIVKAAVSHRDAYGQPPSRGPVSMSTALASAPAVTPASPYRKFLKGNHCSCPEPRQVGAPGPAPARLCTPRLDLAGCRQVRHRVWPGRRAWPPLSGGALSPKNAIKAHGGDASASAVGSAQCTVLQWCISSIPAPPGMVTVLARSSGVRRNR